MFRCLLLPAVEAAAPVPTHMEVVEAVEAAVISKTWRSPFPHKHTRSLWVPVVPEGSARERALGTEVPIPISEP